MPWRLGPSRRRGVDAGQQRRCGGPPARAGPPTVPATTIAASASVSARPVITSASSRLLTNRRGRRVLARPPPRRRRPERGPTTCEGAAPAHRQATRPAAVETSIRTITGTRPVCPRRDPGNLARSWLSNNRLRVRDRRAYAETRRRRRRSALAARAPAHLVADRRAHGRAPCARFVVVTLVGIRAARGGDAARRVGASDVRAPRARLRPRRRARERVAGPPPHELRTDVSFWLSGIGDVYAIPALVAITTLVAVVLRKWRVAAFILTAIAVEAATYRVATLAIHRQRPHVRRLDDLPVSDSFYSGHTAASVAVYCGIALLDHVVGAKRRAARPPCGWSRSRSRCSSRLPGCTAACITRPTSPPACSSASARLIVALTAARAAGAAAEGARAREPGRSYRACRQEHRGRPPRAAPHARPPRVTDPLWAEVPKSQQGAEAGAAPARARGPSTSSCGAATGWRSAASTRSPARAGHDGDRPRRHREPAGLQPRHPEGHRGSGDHRPSGHRANDRRRDA